MSQRTRSQQTARSRGLRTIAWWGCSAIALSSALCACAAGASSEPAGGLSPEDAPDAQTQEDSAAEAQPDAAGSVDTGGTLIEAGPTSDGSAAGCAAGTSLVYVLGKTQELYSFDPSTLQLTQVGVVSCPQSGTATPFSMAIDRDAVAWVLYNDGRMYNVDIGTAACVATSFQPDQGGFKKFGMGFVSDAPGSLTETLYVANEYGIGSIDTESLVVTPGAGTFGFSAAAELTGTGDARLFGLFYGFPPYISEIDKDSSELLGEMPLDTVDIGTGFAYAFWGGDFWVFTAPDGASSQIDRFQPGTGATTTVVASVGFKIIGAGVSTCAPFAAPK